MFPLSTLVLIVSKTVCLQEQCTVLVVRWSFPLHSGWGKTGISRHLIFCDIAKIPYSPTVLVYGVDLVSVIFRRAFAHDTKTPISGFMMWGTISYPSIQCPLRGTGC